MVEIQCAHCAKDIVFKDGRNELNVVICPYKECKGRFNKIDCPHCHKAGIWKQGDFSEGQPTACWNCKKKYAKTKCPNCDEINVFKDGTSFYSGDLISCYSCDVGFSKKKCPHCSKCNVYKDGKSCFNDGNLISCFSCGEGFSSTSCPHCSKVNSFDDGKAYFNNGDSVSCYSCSKTWTQTCCPHCDECRVRTQRGAKPFNAGGVNQCGQCSKYFAELKCSSCDQVMQRKTGRVKDFNDGSVITCPNSSCRARQCRVECPHCQKVINPQYGAGVGDVNLGRPIKCSCGKSFSRCTCPHCDRLNVFKKPIDEGVTFDCYNCKGSVEMAYHEASLGNTTLQDGPGTRMVWHHTKAGKEIGQEGRMRRGSTGCVGAGIYFAETRAECENKALTSGYAVQARIRTGRALIVNKEDLTNTAWKNTTFSWLKKQGYDSVEVRGFKTGTEYVVYNYDQVDLRKVFEIK